MTICESVGCRLEVLALTDMLHNPKSDQKENYLMDPEIPKLTLECVLEKIHYAEVSAEILKRIQHEDVKFTSLHAVHLVQSLFSEQSSDQANVARIILNLESAADDLISISRLIRALV